MRQESVCVSVSVKAVIFDHDDTLVSTIQAKWAEHKYIARTYYGKILTDAEISAHWGKPLPALASALYGDSDPGQALRHIASIHRNFPKTLFADTASVLAAVRASRRAIGVLTATEGWSIRYDYESLGIALDLFDYIQACEDTVHHKPDRRVFDPALTWLAVRGIEPHEVLYVGDGLHDMRAAIDAGLSFVGVSTGLVSVSQFREHGVRAVTALSEICFCCPDGAHEVV